MVTGVLEVEQVPNGDEVPAAVATGAGSVAKISPCVGGTPPPRSMKRDRSFFSRAWISSGLPCSSEVISHLIKTINIIKE